MQLQQPAGHQDVERKTVVQSQGNCTDNGTDNGFYIANMLQAQLVILVIVSLILEGLQNSCFKPTRCWVNSKFT